MNCKPGDLAMLVHPELMENPLCFFDKPIRLNPVKIVKVLKLVPQLDGEIMWSIDEPIVLDHKCIHGEHFTFAISILSDKNLRPIRDPGNTVQTDNPVKITEPV